LDGANCTVTAYEPPGLIGPKLDAPLIIVNGVLLVLATEPLIGAVPVFWILNCKRTVCETLPKLSDLGLTATLPTVFLAALGTPDH
jgi:hypothetical protein